MPFVLARLTLLAGLSGLSLLLRGLPLLTGPIRLTAAALLPRLRGLRLARLTLLPGLLSVRLILLLARLSGLLPRQLLRQFLCALTELVLLARERLELPFHLVSVHLIATSRQLSGVSGNTL